MLHEAWSLAWGLDIPGEVTARLCALARLHPNRLLLPLAVSCKSSSRVARGHTQEADSLSFSFKDGRIRECFWSPIIPCMWHFESLRLGLVTIKMKYLSSQWLFILSLSWVCLIDKKAPKELQGILLGFWAHRTEWRAPSAEIPPGDHRPCSRLQLYSLTLLWSGLPLAIRTRQRYVAKAVKFTAMFNCEERCQHFIWGIKYKGEKIRVCVNKAFKVEQLLEAFLPTESVS